MANFKLKIQQVVINSAKQYPYYYEDDLIVFNLNTCFAKKTNNSKFLQTIREAVQDCAASTMKLNLCNLASLCHKLNISYDSVECLDFVHKVVSNIHTEFPEVELTQEGVYNCGEYDLCPMKSLVSFDSINTIVMVNSILLDCLKTLGFVESQMYNIIDYTKDLRNIIPPDLVTTLPLVNPQNLKQYRLIEEILTHC